MRIFLSHLFRQGAIYFGVCYTPWEWVSLFRFWILPWLYIKLEWAAKPTLKLAPSFGSFVLLIPSLLAEGAWPFGAWVRVCTGCLSVLGLCSCWDNLQRHSSLHVQEQVLLYSVSWAQWKCDLYLLCSAEIDLLMMLGFRSVGFSLFRRDERFQSVCNSPLISEHRCHRQMQMGSSKTLPMQELPGLEEFHCYFLSDGPFSDASHACLVALQKAALLCMIWGCKESPSCSSFLGSCK